MTKPALWGTVGALCLILLTGVTIALLRGGSDHTSTRRQSPELEYLKSVNSVAPPTNPELLFVLMTQFANSNLQAEGAEFFAARLREFEPRLQPVQKSL